MGSLDVVKKGMTWRVGDGEGIKIWSDPWIPRDFSRRLITPRRHSILTEVKDLVDPPHRKLDDELVRDTFWAKDANLILALPIHQGQENTLAWHFDKHGVFSVKSAYKVAREDRLRCTNNNGN